MRTYINHTLKLVMGLGLIAGLSGCDKDRGPSVEDHFLNYEIPNVELTADCPVGAFYYQKGNLDDGKLARLAQPWDQSKGQLGANVRPILTEQMNFDVKNPESVELYQQQVDWAIQGRIDFFILPAIQIDLKTFLNSGNVTMTEVLGGKKGAEYTDDDTGETITGNPVQLQRENGRLRYAISINPNNITNGLSNSKLIEDMPDETISTGEKMSRTDIMCKAFEQIAVNYFGDDNYYHINGRPLVVIFNPHKIYTKDSKALYDKLRTAVREACGKEIFIVAQQDAWAPTGRFEVFHCAGKVDAITTKSMYDQNNFNRAYMYPQMIDQNWKYNQEFAASHFQIDFIPTISPSRNAYINMGNQYNQPIVDKNPDTFRTMCNVAKRHLGGTRIVFLESFNDWAYYSAIEPTDPEYGNGYGMTYLDILREQFKL